MKYYHSSKFLEFKKYVVKIQVYEDKNASSEIILTYCISLGTRVTSTEITMELKVF